MDLAEHRPELLRHCYRMLGSYADAEDVVQEVLASAWKSRDAFRGDVPVRHWLMRSATNACLNAIKKRRILPQLEQEPAPEGTPIGEVSDAAWITPAPDAELRESVALAFVALLQNVPPRQRAVLLLKDVAGFSAEEIAVALELTVPSVNSALHRARSLLPAAQPVFDEPPPEALREWIRCWEERDLLGLVALMRDDIVFSMPPWPMWFRGARAVKAFFENPRFDAFWSAGLRLKETRANGQPALIFYRGGVLHSIQVLHFRGGKIAESETYVGAEFAKPFGAPEQF